MTWQVRTWAESSKTAKLWGVKLKGTGAQVILSSVLLVRGKDVGRNRCITQIITWLCGWCCHQGFGFHDHRTLFDDYNLLGRDGIQLTRKGK